MIIPFLRTSLTTRLSAQEIVEKMKGGVDRKAFLVGDVQADRFKLYRPLNDRTGARTRMPALPISDFAAPVVIGRIVETNDGTTVRLTLRPRAILSGMMVALVAFGVLGVYSWYSSSSPREVWENRILTGLIGYGVFLLPFHIGAKKELDYLRERLGA